MSDVDTVQTAGELRLAIGRLVRAARDKDVMPLAQTNALGFLDRNGPMTTSDLAALLRVRQQSMARTVALLVEGGQVEQYRHPTDGRKILLRLTEAGQAELQGTRDRRVEWLADAIGTRLNPAEQATLAAAVPLLARLAED